MSEKYVDLWPNTQTDVDPLLIVVIIGNQKRFCIWMCRKKRNDLILCYPIFLHVFLRVIVKSWREVEIMYFIDFIVLLCSCVALVCTTCHEEYTTDNCICTENENIVCILGSDCAVQDVRIDQNVETISIYGRLCGTGRANLEGRYTNIILHDDQCLNLRNCKWVQLQLFTVV